MSGASRHRFQFEGKTPFVFLAVVSLLFVNTLLILLLEFGAKYVLPKASPDLQPCKAFAQGGIQYHAPGIVCWYPNRSIATQFILLALMAAILIIFRKRVEYISTSRR
jgi:hypothetical protein